MFLKSEPRNYKIVLQPPVTSHKCCDVSLTCPAVQPVCYSQVSSPHPEAGSRRRSPWIRRSAKFTFMPTPACWMLGGVRPVPRWSYLYTARQLILFNSNTTFSSTVSNFSHLLSYGYLPQLCRIDVLPGQNLFPRGLIAVLPLPQEGGALLPPTRSEGRGALEHKIIKII